MKDSYKTENKEVIRLNNKYLNPESTTANLKAIRNQQIHDTSV